MKNSQQLKALIRNIANKKGIAPQSVMQIYMLERFLERMALSKYKRNFIVKGGFLISAMVGIGERTTMDMDATIKGCPLEKNKIEQMIKEIITVDVDDGVSFDYIGLSDIRLDSEYNGFRVRLMAKYMQLRVQLKLDITTGDVITPYEIEYDYPLMFEDRTIGIMSYNLLTVLAEKLEAIFTVGVASTRVRDYYDVYMLFGKYHQVIDYQELHVAIEETSGQRGHLDKLENYRSLLKVFRENRDLNNQWVRYQNDNSYALGISFNSACNAVEKIMDLIYEK